jgi:hypothetical protein
MRIPACSKLDKRRISSRPAAAGAIVDRCCPQRGGGDPRSSATNLRRTGSNFGLGLSRAWSAGPRR